MGKEEERGKNECSRFITSKYFHPDCHKHMMRLLLSTVAACNSLQAQVAAAQHKPVLLSPVFAAATSP